VQVQYKNDNYMAIQRPIKLINDKISFSFSF